MNFRKNLGRSALLGSLVALGLAGCGGSDNDSDEPEAVPATTYPVEAVLQALFTTSNTLLSSTYVDPANREDFVFATSIIPDASGGKVLFEGKPGIEMNVSRLTTVVTRNGVKVWEQPGSASLLYTSAPFLWHGQIDDEGTYSVHSPVNRLPEKATIGTRGNWFVSTDYVSREKMNEPPKQTTTVDYYLAAGDAAGTAWLCLDFQVKEQLTGATHSSATCLKTNDKGAVLQVKREGDAAL